MNILFSSIIVAALILSVYGLQVRDQSADREKEIIEWEPSKPNLSATSCNKTCITTCDNLPAGEYVSCQGCDKYVLCWYGWFIDNMSCKDKVWSEEKKDCSFCECPIGIDVNGEWGMWGPFDECSRSCGLGGVKRRQRTCDSPAPAVNGLPCPGSDKQVLPCNENVTCPDCARICPNGRLNSLCTLCECENRIIGTVKVGPIGLADVEIRAVNQAWSPIATTNSQGTFEINGYCSQGLQLIAVKTGYGTAQYSYAATVSASVDIPMYKLERPSITSNPANQVAYEGSVVTLSCSATKMITIEWFLNGIILNSGVQDAQGTSTLEVTEAGEYKCRAVSKAGKTFSTTAVVTFISAQVADTCSDVKSNIRTLEQSCTYTDSNNVINDAVDIGTCGTEACISTGTNGKSDKCCIGVRKTMLDIKCEGFSYQQAKITKCGCSVCSPIRDVYITGVLMGDNFDASETDSTITVRDYNGPSIKVQPNGKFTFASEFKENVVFWVEADNIVTRYVVVNLQDDVEEYFLEVTVVLKPAPQLVSASQNSSQVNIISPAGLSNVASLSFPRDAFQYRDGRQFTGNVKVYASFADPRNEQSILGASAEFSFVDDEGISRLLETYGVATVTATSEGGEPLEITGQLTMSVDAPALGIRSITGTSAALLWTIDLESGGWEKYGSFNLAPSSTSRREKRAVPIIDGKIVLPPGVPVVNLDSPLPNLTACYVSIKVTTGPQFIHPLSGVKLHGLSLVPYNGRMSFIRSRAYTNTQGMACIITLCNTRTELMMEGTVLVHPTHNLPTGFIFTNIVNGVQINVNLPTTPVQDGPVFSSRSKCYKNTKHYFQLSKPVKSMVVLLSGNQGTLNVVEPALGARLSWQPIDKPVYTMCAVSLLIHHNNQNIRVFGESREQTGLLYGTYMADLKLAWPQAINHFVSCVLVRCPNNYRNTMVKLQIVSPNRKICKLLTSFNLNTQISNQAKIYRTGQSNTAQNLTINNLTPSTLPGGSLHMGSGSTLKSATLAVLNDCQTNYLQSIAYYGC